MYALCHLGCEKQLHCSGRKSKLRLAFCLCLVCFFEKRRSTMLVSPKSFSKPSIRKHSCFEKLFVEGNLHQHLQEKQPALSFTFSALPSSPSKKAYPKIYTCICFLLCFFITLAAFLRCNKLEMPEGREKSSPLLQYDPEEPEVDSAMEKSMATPALKGLGSMYRKGTKAMSELVVAHIEEDASIHDLRWFIRTLHRSGVSARADVVFLYAWDIAPSAMVDVILEENLRLCKLMHLLSDGEKREVHDAEASNSSSSSSVSVGTLSTLPCAGCRSSNSTISPFNMNAFRKPRTDIELHVQPLWGVHNPNASQTNRTDGAHSIEWGSMVGFAASELNPDDTLHGFIDRPPLELRRWACYQMLLGMVRHKFKHILLTDVSGVAILRDPFVMVGKRRVGLYLSMEDRAWGATSFGFGLRRRSADVNTVSEPAITLRNTSSSGTRRQLYAQGGISSRERPNGMAAFLQDRSSLAKRAGRQHVYARRRSNGGRRRRGRKGAAMAGGGLYERVYGKRMWSSLEESEKKKKLVDSAVILGSLQQIRGLANAMVTEIVKVALERKSREAFPDSVLLSYLLHKSSSVLGKKVVDHLHLMENADSFVHCLVGSEQPSLFFKKTRVAYPIIHGNSRGKRWINVVRAIRHDLCSSPTDADAYADCSKLA